jgi:micrococcal nuclease
MSGSGVAGMTGRALRGTSRRVGKLLPFRRRRRWSKAGDYDPRTGRTRFWPDPKRQVTARGLWRDFLFWLRPVGLFTVLAISWIAVDPALVEPPRFLSGEPEPVDMRFTRCGPGRGRACVIDGDTFKIGERKVRVIGIDTAEVDAQCPAEAAMAERSTAALQRLLNQGPFNMVGRIGNQQDRHGRDLRAIIRVREDGSVQSIADDMRATGGARRYLGGLRGGWC